MYKREQEFSVELDHMLFDRDAKPTHEKPRTCIIHGDDSSMGRGLQPASLFNVSGTLRGGAQETLFPGGRCLTGCPFISAFSALSLSGWRA